MPPDDPQDAAVIRALSGTAIGSHLSSRQLDVLARMSRGLSRAEVAAELGVSVAAVDYHGRLLRDAIVAYESSGETGNGLPRTEIGTFSCRRISRAK